MLFRSEQAAVQELAELILDAAANLYRCTKYIYSLSLEDYYNCDIKDVFKIILNNIFEADHLHALHLTLDDAHCGPMNGKEYSKVFSLIVYSFAVRIPLLKGVDVKGDRLTDQQLRAIYEYVLSKGVVNHDDAIGESYEEIRLCMRKGRPVPPYGADWYKAYLYRNIPQLAEVNNRNLFLFGTADVLFVLFYLRLQEELGRLLHSLCILPQDL